MTGADEIPVADPPSDRRSKPGRWIVVAVVAVVAALIALLVGGGPGRDHGSVAPETTTAGPTEPSVTDLVAITELAQPSSTTPGLGDSVLTAGTSAETTTSSPATAPPRRTVPPATEPTSTWLPGLDGVGWTLGGPFPFEITSCETSEYTAAIFDPYDITTSLTLGWTYIGESGATVTGTVPLTKSWYQHLGSEWKGVFIPSTAPQSEMTRVFQTLTATDAAGNSRVILSTSPLLRLSPCTPADSTTIAPSTTSTAPLP